MKPTDQRTFFPAWVLPVILGGVSLAIYGGVFGGTARREWVPINDPGALRREAAALCRDGGGWHELQPAQYPAAMAALHPASISVSAERVYVALVPVPGGRTRYHGYYIWPETVERPDGGIVREESNGERAGPDRLRR